MEKFDLAKEILLQVRQPGAIKLKSLEFDSSNLTLAASFNYPPSEAFPNPSLQEVTGGQLIDGIAQSGYLCIGFILKKTPIELGFDFGNYLNALNLHRVNFTKCDFSFHKPCLVNKDFTVTSTLLPQRKNSFCRKLGRGANTKAILLSAETKILQYSDSEEKLIGKAIVTACYRV